MPAQHATNCMKPSAQTIPLLIVKSRSGSQSGLLVGKLRPCKRDDEQEKKSADKPTQTRQHHDPSREESRRSGRRTQVLGLCWVSLRYR
jgi:hypothetical protein